MILRRAAAGDAEAICVLEERLFGSEAWSASSVVAELAGSDRFAVVAARDDEVLGYAVTMRAGDGVDLQRIAVHPSIRRSGVAHALLATAADQARADHAERIMLEVSARNRPAVEFYAKEGFVEVARRYRYYRDGSDALVLEREP